MNATLPTSACPPACNACRLRRTGAFTPVQPEQLDFIQRFRADTATVPAGGAVVHENQDNAQCRSVKSERHFFDGILGLGHTNLTRIPPVGSARRQHEAADVLSHGRKLGRDGPRGV